MDRPTKKKVTRKKEPVCASEKGSVSKQGQVLTPGDAHTFSFHFEHFEAVQFDFYLPVKIYFHRATQSFLASIGALAPGATIFRGATGIWKKEQEDTYIHRFIIRTGEFTADNLRMGIRVAVRHLMAELGEWMETIQQQVMFTETLLCMNTTDLTNPPIYATKATEKKSKQKS